MLCAVSWLCTLILACVRSYASVLFALPAVSAFRPPLAAFLLIFLARQVIAVDSSVLLFVQRQDLLHPMAADGFVSFTIS